MRIIAFDPGTRIVGFALLDSDADRLLYHGARPLRGDTADERLDSLPDVLRLLLPDGVDVDLVAVERMFSSARGSDSSLAVAAYLIRRRARRLGIVVVEIPPSTAKKAATGRGNATKREVRSILEARFGERFACDDVADAVAVALAAAEMVEHEEAS